MPIDCSLGPDRMVYAWAVWCLAFPAMETYALVTGRTTFTAWSRRALDLDPAGPLRAASSAGIVAACGWTAAHLLTGGYVPAMRRIRPDSVGVTR